MKSDAALSILIFSFIHVLDGFIRIQMQNYYIMFEKMKVNSEKYGNLNSDEIKSKREYGEILKTL